MTNDLLNFNPEEMSDRIAGFIEEKRQQLGREGVVLGLSGGLDSAVTAWLVARGVERERITLLSIPEKDSKRLHQRDAKLIAEMLEIPLRVHRISAVLVALGVYRLLPLRFVPGRALKSALVRFGRNREQIKGAEAAMARFHSRAGTLVARGNAYISAKHRVRMITLYQYANIHNLMVVGAANRTEWLTGTFVHWGCDHCADVMPILHLYRSQVEKLAEYLHIPKAVRTKPADPDVIPGLDDKEMLLGSFEVADQILWGLEGGIPKEELAERFDPQVVKRVAELWAASRFMRETPYSLNPW